MATIGYVYVLVGIICISLIGSIVTQNIDLTYSIEEEKPAMILVGNVLEDSNVADFVPPGDIQELRFSFLTEGNPDASYLWINSTSGQLRTSSRIDREALCPRENLCQLQVQTVVQAQLGAFFRIVRVTVTVTDINDNTPSFSPPFVTLRIPEDERTGTAHRLPVAFDPDMDGGNSVISYNDVDNVSPFTLAVTGSSSSGFEVRLRLDSELDRESTSSYDLIVHAVDGGNPSLTGTLTVKIEVLDVNDNKPMFEKLEYNVNVSESIPVDSVAAKVTARDLDAGENGALTYALRSLQEDPVVFRIFSINESSGEIRTMIPLDTYAGHTYRLVIEVYDGGSTPKSDATEVVISVLDTHNSDPEILLNVFGVGGLAQVSELAELGRVVAHVAVSDPDSSLSPNGQVTCNLDSDQFQLQAMDVNQFKVVLKKRLDREEKAFHSVNLVCEDSGNPPLNTSANFIVEVQDENDNAPVFDSVYYTASVTEGPNADADSDILVTVHASDKDTEMNARISYRLAEPSDSDFGIYTDGSIIVTNPNGVDREDPIKGDTRQLVVLAVDSGIIQMTATTTVVVSIRDINDNPPKFDEPMYYFNVAEDAPAGHVVSNVSASDVDLEINSIFYFKMREEDVNKVPFDVGLDGTIKVSGDIDRETKKNYQFGVIAYDLGEPASLSSTVTVHVKINDVNDNSPQFSFPNDENYTLYVPHTLSANTAFANVIATDIDDGRNGDLVYARDSGNGSRFFDIVSDSGQVVLIRPLSLRELGLHILAVTAHDKGLEAQMATQSMLHIVVYEGNATTMGTDKDGLGSRNIVVVVVLVVVTVVLALAILLTILLIRRVDKQRRLYNAKHEEAKVDSNLKHLNPCSTSGLESPSNLSDLSGDSKDSVKKKKEVSFSLNDENNMNKPPAMSSFSSGIPEKYDAIPDNERGKVLKNDMFYSNHNQADRHTKSSNSKKDVVNFHQVHPVSHGSHNRQPIDAARHHDDNLSEVSADISTSDSGRGGSDVELQSHGGISKDSVDTSFASQRGFNLHNNLNASVSNGSSIHSSSTNSMKPSNNKSVHFQNIHPDPMGLGSFLSPNLPPQPSGLPPRAPIRSQSGSPSSKNGPGPQRYASNTFLEDDGSYVKLANNGRRSNPSNQELELHRNRMLSDNFAANQNKRHMKPTHPDGEYMDMTGVVASYMQQRANSNSCLDRDGAWDGDTTTSGSYTVDPQELCDEIDKLFFDDIQDVVV